MLGKITGAAKGLTGAAKAAKAKGKKKSKGAQQDPMKKMLEKFSKVKSPEEAAKLRDRLLKKLEEKGQATPEIRKMIESAAQAAGAPPAAVSQVQGQAA